MLWILTTSGIMHRMQPNPMIDSLVYMAHLCMFEWIFFLFSVVESYHQSCFIISRFNELCNWNKQDREQSANHKRPFTSDDIFKILDALVYNANICKDAFWTVVTCTIVTKNAMISNMNIHCMICIVIKVVMGSPKQWENLSQQSFQA